VISLPSLVELFREISNGEPAAPHVRDRFPRSIESGVPLALCVVNWGELVYQFERFGGTAAATSVICDMGNLPIEIEQEPFSRSVNLARVLPSAGRRPPPTRQRIADFDNDAALRDP
jgi:hypothetical protein